MSHFGVPSESAGYFLILFSDQTTSESGNQSSISFRSRDHDHGRVPVWSGRCTAMVPRPGTCESGSRPHLPTITLQIGRRFLLDTWSQARQLSCCHNYYYCWSTNVAVSIAVLAYALTVQSVRPRRHTGMIDVTAVTVTDRHKRRRFDRIRRALYWTDLESRFEHSLVRGGVGVVLVAFDHQRPYDSDSRWNSI